LTFKIALDAMGGDFCPESNIFGAIEAVRKYPFHVILVGDQDLLKKEISAISNFPHDRISIEHAEETIEMAESAAISYRKKKKSSIHVGLNMVKEGAAHAFVSAGNTGAVLTASTFILGRLPGVDRPALAAAIPCAEGHFTMLDMGSNVDCKSAHLVQFAIMGHCFSKSVMGVKSPRVGLLNIGEEKDKGNDLSRETFNLLAEQKFNFIGNVEGKCLTQGRADVVVCDGFVGNNLLKFGEGITTLFKDFFKKEAKTSVLSFIGLLFLRSAFKRFKLKFDYDEYGGAHILGINGITIIAHGSAKPRAICSALRMAFFAVQSNMNTIIKEELSKMVIHESETEII
jgi:glycerol-3-phosphate acyltransferase PlsX